MVAHTSRTGLTRPTNLDQHLTDHYVEDNDILDDIPGPYICTSVTRPSTWGVAQAGRPMYETDTKLLWHWSGSAWQRVYPKGLLGEGSRTTNLSTTSTTPVSVVSVTVTIPAGGRSVAVTATWSRISNTVGITSLTIYKDGALWRGSWGVQGDDSGSPTDGEQGASITFIDTAPDAGSTIYSLRMSTQGSGTSLFTCTTARPAQIIAIEV